MIGAVRKKNKRRCNGQAIPVERVRTFGTERELHVVNEIYVTPYFPPTRNVSRSIDFHDSELLYVKKKKRKKNGIEERI